MHKKTICSQLLSNKLELQRQIESFCSIMLNYSKPHSQVCTIKELNQRTSIQVLLRLEHGNNEIGSDDPSFEGKVESARTSNHFEAKY
jgi:hypothetical protein